MIFRNWVLQNFPFLEDDFDALTDYELFCKMMEYVKEFAKDNEDFNKRLTDLENYIKNLDLQDEVNNKLDEMAQDGTLEEIILAYINTQAVFIYDTIDDLKEATNLVKGSYAKTLGFHEKNDGGGALYQLSDTGTANGKDVILCDNDLLAVLIPDENNLYPEQFGAYGDGSHNDTEVISYILSNHKHLKFHGKTYFIKELEIPTNKILEGVSNNNSTSDNVGGTIFIGDNSTDGLMIYTSNRNSVILKNITLQAYRNAIFCINCVKSIFENIYSRENQVGAVFGGISHSNRFYNCYFTYNTVDGLQCGLPVNHPTTSEVINPDIATFDFFSCSFSYNNRYGINGWLRVFNFYGGYCENNGTAGVRMENTGTNHTIGNSFFGFDIENELIGYLFEATDNNRLYVTNITVDGGQITLRNEDNETSSCLYFKGNSCDLRYVYNIKVNTRTTVQSTNEQYSFYCDVASGSPTLEIDMNTGNINNSVIRSNAARYLPNNIYKITDNEIPLQLLGGTYYDYSNNKIVLPSHKHVIFNSAYLRFIHDVIVTATGTGNVRVRVYGKSIANEYKAVGSSTGSFTAENEYTASISLGGNCDSFIIVNEGNSDITLSRVAITGYMTN